MDPRANDAELTCDPLACRKVVPSWTCVADRRSHTVGTPSVGMKYAHMCYSLCAVSLFEDGVFMVGTEPWSRMLTARYLQHY